MFVGREYELGRGERTERTRPTEYPNTAESIPTPTILERRPDSIRTSHDAVRSATRCVGERAHHGRYVPPTLSA